MGILVGEWDCHEFPTVHGMWVWVVCVGGVTRLRMWALFPCLYMYMYRVKNRVEGWIGYKWSMGMEVDRM